MKHGDPLAEKKDVLGVAVTWTGRGTMAIIAILEKGSENSEKIVGIDFCVLDGECTNLLMEPFIIFELRRLTRVEVLAVAICRIKQA